MSCFLHTLLASLFLLIPSLDVFSQDLLELCEYYDSKKGSSIPKIRVAGKKYVIKVRNENDFNHVNNAIISALKNGEKNIVVCLNRGTYHFHQNHIDLREIDYPEASIIIEGNGATIMPESRNYIGSVLKGSVWQCNYSGHYTPESLFITDQGDVLDVWTVMRHSAGAVEVLSNYEAAISTEFRNISAIDSRIRIPHWYYSTQYPILSISGNGIITFKANVSMGFDMDYRGMAVLDYDYAVSKEPVRYQCFNVENDEVPYCIENKLYFSVRFKSLRECLSGHFVVMAGTNLKQFRINGLNCFGSRGGGHYINLSSVHADKVAFTNCTFKGLKNTVLMINKTHNVSFSNNTVENCLAQGVYSINGSKNTIVNDCVFSNNGQSMIQHSCICCMGDDYHIYKNEIRDFTYSAITVGIHYSNEEYTHSSGIIENNEIYYTQYFWDNYWKYTLADGGAIYISSYNDEVIIRNNHIHDYKGISGNRAIFGDTGAKNVIVYSNVIQRVPNYYAIDFYRVESVDKYIADANSGNMVFCNYIDGAYKIGGRDDGSCVEGGNIMVSNPYNRFNSNNVKGSSAIMSNIITTDSANYSQKREMKRDVPTYNNLMRIKDKAIK